MRKEVLRGVSSDKAIPEDAATVRSPSWSPPVKNSVSDASGKRGGFSPIVARSRAGKNGKWERITDPISRIEE